MFYPLICLKCWQIPSSEKGAPSEQNGTSIRRAQTPVCVKYLIYLPKHLRSCWSPELGVGALQRGDPDLRRTTAASCWCHLTGMKRVPRERRPRSPRTQAVQWGLEPEVCDQAGSGSVKRSWKLKPITLDGVRGPGGTAGKLRRSK